MKKRTVSAATRTIKNKVLTQKIGTIEESQVQSLQAFNLFTIVLFQSIANPYLTDLL